MMMTEMSSDRDKEVSTYHIHAPLQEDKIKRLKAGDSLYLSGTIYGAKEADHKRMLDGLEISEQLPLDLRDTPVFYVGPSPALSA